MTSYEAIEFLERLPKSGVIEIVGSEMNLYFIASSCTYEAHGDSSIIVRGKTGFGNIATVESTMLMDADRIACIRHTRGTEP